MAKPGNFAIALDHLSESAERAEQSPSTTIGEGRGGLLMNQGRSNRLVLHFDPGSSNQRLLDVTELQGSYTSKMRAAVALPLGEDEVIARFLAINSQAAASANGAVKIGSTPVRTTLVGAPVSNVPAPQRPQSNLTEKTAMASPANGVYAHQPMGQPAPPIDGASPFMRPQISQPEFSSPALEPVPPPAKALYWDVPGHEKVPEFYHDLLLDEDKKQLILVRDARYRGFNTMRAPAEVGENAAFNLAGSNEVYYGSLVGRVWQYGNNLYQTFYVVAILPLVEYLEHKTRAATPVSPFQSELESEYPPDSPPLVQPTPPPASPLPTLDELYVGQDSAPSGVLGEYMGILPAYTETNPPSVGDFLESAMNDLLMSRSNIENAGRR